MHFHKSNLLRRNRLPFFANSAILILLLTLTASVPAIAEEIAPSNASFDASADQNELTVDFGTVGLRHDPSLAITVANLTGGKKTAGLNFLGLSDDSSLAPAFELVEVRKIKKGEHTLPLKRFVAMAAGNSRQLRLLFDASTLGTHTATFHLSFSDKTDHQQNLTIRVTGSVTAEGSPDVPDLIYDPDTGEVTIDSSESAPLIAYVLHATEDLFDEAFQPFFPTPEEGGLALPATITDQQLAEVKVPPGESKRASIGNIFPAGMDTLALDQYLPERQAQFGSKLGSLTSKPFDLVVVGEAPPQPPSTWSFTTWLALAAAVALTGLLIAIRRSKQ